MADWSGTVVGGVLAIYGILLIVFSRWFAALTRRRRFRRWYRRSSRQVGNPPVLPATAHPTWSLERATAVIVGVIFLLTRLFDLVRSFH
jgi:hypothetical protein